MNKKTKRKSCIVCERALGPGHGNRIYCLGCTGTHSATERRRLFKERMLELINAFLEQQLPDGEQDALPTPE